MTNRQIFRLILSYLSPYRWSVVVVIFSIFGVSGAILGLGKAIKELIDKGITLGNSSHLNTAILYITMLIAILGFTSFTRSYFINSLSEKVIRDIRQKVYNHLLTVKFQQFETLKDSDIVSRLFADIDLISRIIIDIFSFCIRNSLLFIGGICLMFAESIKLSLVVLLTIPIIMIYISSLGKKVRILSRNTQTNIAAISEYVGETFRGIKAIYAAGAQGSRSVTFSGHLHNALAVSLQRLRLRALFFALAITTVMCSITFVVWMGSQDVLHSRMSSGQLVSFIIYAAYSGISIGGLFEIFGDVQRYLAGAERVFAMLEINDTELQASADTAKIIINTQKSQIPIIQYHNVNFAYPSRPDQQILHDLSFEINSGEFVGIVGTSGSGKSTVLQLLVKFFDTFDGRILAFGTSYDTITAAAIRQRVVLVPQDPFMFSGTIRDNILLTESSADLNSVLSHVGLADFIDTLPDGLETSIGSLGSKISGGQKQRIAIARALCSNPDVLVLDEATNALDQESEKLIMNKIKQLMRHKTIIAVTHRVTSLEHTNKIIVMEHGRVLDVGTDDQLSTRCSLYMKLKDEEL